MQSTNRTNRRNWLRRAALLAAGSPLLSSRSFAANNDERSAAWLASAQKGLNWLSDNQSSRGHWNTRVYPAALAALAGTALIGSGSTTTQGPYSKQVARTADFLISKSRENGLIGDPRSDQRYTYGHGFAMLFLPKCWVRKAYSIAARNWSTF